MESETTTEYRDRQFLDALEKLDVSADTADHVADVREAYMNGEIDEDELEARLVGAVTVTGDTSPDSEKDVSLFGKIGAAVCYPLDIGLLKLFHRLSTDKFKKTSLRWRDRHLRIKRVGDTDKDPAESAGALKASFKIFAPVQYWAFAAAIMMETPEDGSLVTLVSSIVALLLLCGAVLGFMASTPTVTVRNVGKGEYTTK